MNSRDELEAFIMLIRAMNGEQNVIENMEKEGQERAVANCMMAKEMEPSKKEWEQLGFRFIDIPDDDVLCKAVLPEGWSIRPTDHSMWSDIYDNNNLKRGSMFYKSSFYDRKAHMSLMTRYRVHKEYIDEDYNKTEIYFGSDDEKLFVVGQVNISDDDPRDVILEKYDQQREMEEIARQYGDENYPDWRSVHAYWEPTNDLSLKKNKNN